MRRQIGPLFAVALAALVAVAAHAKVPTASAKKVASQSIGAPNAGRLENGAHLVESPFVRYVNGYAGDSHYGVRELVSGIDHAAREVKRRFPDAVLGVGQLSRKGGGDIDRHHSHESGRDADVAFYLVDSLGKSVQRDRFYTIGPDGRAVSDRALRFDDARNWTLISALVNDPKMRVTHVFVVSYLRTRLLAYGARVGASPVLRQRIAEVLMQPRHALPHDDHFHVRVACPWSSGKCVENAVLHSASKKPAAGPKLVKIKTKPKAPKLPTKKLVRARSTGKPKPLSTTI
jgi:penicillin-insensitive murein endopeptidase